MRVSISAPARRDINRAAAYYARVRPSLGREFVIEVDRTPAVLRENPWLGQRLDDTYRRMQLGKFPYSLMYRLNNEQKLIRISVVAHQRRRPGFWRNRVEDARPFYRAA